MRIPKQQKLRVKVMKKRKIYLGSLIIGDRERKAEHHLGDPAKKDCEILVIVLK